jgi:hypothetical protein
MAKLCPRGKAAAKRKFKVYPSAYAKSPMVLIRNVVGVVEKKEKIIQNACPLQKQERCPKGNVRVP